MLTYLLAHRHRVVDRQELCEQVWPDQFISEATLSSTIRSARNAIGDTGSARQFIQTKHGQGYRFIAPVTMLADTFDETEVAAPETDVDPDGPPIAEFHMASGTPDLLYCPQCGTETLPQAKFCASCVATLPRQSPRA